MSRKIEGMRFATPFSKRERYYSDPGSHYRNEYEITIDKKGHKSLHKTGEVDQWEEIQSYKEECDIGNIIARAAAGDLNALNQRKGIYADITNTPRDLAEAQNNIIKLNNEFYKLPVEIREKFDNSKERFVQEFGSVEWYEKMGFEFSKPENAEKAGNVEFVPGTSDTVNNVLTPEEK